MHRRNSTLNGNEREWEGGLALWSLCAPMSPGLHSVAVGSWPRGPVMQSSLVFTDSREERPSLCGPSQGSWAGQTPQITWLVKVRSSHFRTLSHLSWVTAHQCLQEGPSASPRGTVCLPPHCPPTLYTTTWKTRRYFFF